MRTLLLLIIALFACSSNDPSTGGISIPNTLQGEIVIANGYILHKLYLEEADVSSSLYVVVDSSAIEENKYQFSYELLDSKKYIITATIFESGEYISYYYVVSSNSSELGVIRFPDQFIKMDSTMFIYDTISLGDTLVLDSNLNATSDVSDTTKYSDTTNGTDTSKTVTSTFPIKTVDGMKLIPGGDFSWKENVFTNGIPTTLSPFYMDSVEVSNKEIYDRLGIENSYGITYPQAIIYCNEVSKDAGLDTVYTYKVVAGEGDYSAIRIDSVQCNMSVDAYRMPTEAEWEYVARGGVDTKYYWGDDPLTMNEYEAIYGAVDNLIKPNQYGIYNIFGSYSEFLSGSAITNDGTQDESLYYALFGTSGVQNPISNEINSYNLSTALSSSPIYETEIIIRNFPTSVTTDGKSVRLVRNKN